MSDIKLAVAIPTYNSFECLHELLVQEYETLSENNCDIYIYDSSIDNETQKLIQEHWERDNILYNRLNAEIASNEKVYYLFQEISEMNKYDFIWMRRDAHFFSRNILNYILNIVKNKYDIILLDNFPGKSINDLEEIEDKVEYFSKATYIMTSYGATIIKCKTVLKDVDWEYLRKRYINMKCINFSHVALYLEQIAKLDKFCALYFKIPSRESTESKKRKNSFWKSEVIRIWSECWISMLERLPNLYLQDKNIFNKVMHLPPKRYTRKSLLTFCSDGIFDFECFLQYKDYLLRVSDISEKEMSEIARMEPDEAEYTLNKEIKEELSEFADRFQTIVIYGAGMCARRHALYLENFGISYECFVVSKLGDMTTLNNHEIKEYSEIKGWKDTGIVLGLGKANRIEVLPQLVKDGFCDKICYIDVPSKLGRENECKTK